MMHIGQLVFILIGFHFVQTRVILIRLQDGKSFAKHNQIDATNGQRDTEDTLRERLTNKEDHLNQIVNGLNLRGIEQSGSYGDVNNNVVVAKDDSDVIKNELSSHFLSRLKQAVGYDYERNGYSDTNAEEHDDVTGLGISSSTTGYSYSKSASLHISNRVVDENEAHNKGASEAEYTRDQQRINNHGGKGRLKEDATVFHTLSGNYGKTRESGKKEREIVDEPQYQLVEHKNKHLGKLHVRRAWKLSTHLQKMDEIRNSKRSRMQENNIQTETKHGSLVQQLPFHKRNTKSRVKRDYGYSRYYREYHHPMVDYDQRYSGRPQFGIDHTQERPQYRRTKRNSQSSYTYGGHGPVYGGGEIGGRSYDYGDYTNGDNENYADRDYGDYVDGGLGNNGEYDDYDSDYSVMSNYGTGNDNDYGESENYDAECEYGANIYNINDGATDNNVGGYGRQSGGHSGYADDYGSQSRGQFSYGGYRRQYRDYGGGYSSYSGGQGGYGSDYGTHSEGSRSIRYGGGYVDTGGNGGNDSGYGSHGVVYGGYGDGGHGEGNTENGGYYGGMLFKPIGVFGGPVGMLGGQWNLNIYRSQYTIFNNLISGTPYSYPIYSYSMPSFYNQLVGYGNVPMHSRIICDQIYPVYCNYPINMTRQTHLDKHISNIISVKPIVNPNTNAPYHRQFHSIRIYNRQLPISPISSKTHPVPAFYNTVIPNNPYLYKFNNRYPVNHNKPYPVNISNQYPVNIWKPYSVNPSNLYPMNFSNWYPVNPSNSYPVNPSNSYLLNTYNPYFMASNYGQDKTYKNSISTRNVDKSTPSTIISKTTIRDTHPSLTVHFLDTLNFKPNRKTK